MTYSKKQKEYSIQYAKDNLKRIPLDVKRDYYNNVVKIEAKKEEFL